MRKSLVALAALLVLVLALGGSVSVGLAQSATMVVPITVTEAFLVVVPSFFGAAIPPAYSLRLVFRAPDGSTHRLSIPVTPE